LAAVAVPDLCEADVVLLLVAGSADAGAVALRAQRVLNRQLAGVAAAFGSERAIVLLATASSTDCVGPCADSVVGVLLEVAACPQPALRAAAPMALCAMFGSHAAARDGVLAAVLRGTGSTTQAVAHACVDALGHMATRHAMELVQYTSVLRDWIAAAAVPAAVGAVARVLSTLAAALRPLLVRRSCAHRFCASMVCDASM
jgi:hypothetical protein